MVRAQIGMRPWGRPSPDSCPVPPGGARGARRRLQVPSCVVAGRGSGAWARHRRPQLPHGWVAARGRRRDPPAVAVRVSTEDHRCMFCLWRGLGVGVVRKSSPRSPGRPPRRDGGGGDGGAAAGSAWGAEAARWPAGERWSPRPGGTMGSFPERPRPRC
jgi:hypothetical protein